MPEPRQRWTVLAAGWQRVLGEHWVRLKTGEFCLEHVVSGRGFVDREGRRYELGPEAVSLHGPGGEYRWSSRPTEAMTHRFVRFEGPLLTHRGMGDPNVPNISYPDTKGRVHFHLNELLRSNLREPAEDGGSAEFHLEALIDALFQAPGGTVENLGGAFTTFSRCKAYLVEHATEIRRVDEVAARFRISAAYLCRLFSRFSHESPHQLLQRLRMERAAQLMRSRGMRVQEAAACLGMDPFHFSRVFKRVHGASPSTFAPPGNGGTQPTPTAAPR